MSIADARGLPGLHLYHHGLSSCSQRVRVLLHELDLPWTSHLVDLRTHAHLSPEYRAINRQALVPALIDDGDVVIESCDILRHLARDGRMAGGDDPLLALADRTQGALKTLTHEWMFRARGTPNPSAPRHPDPEAQAFAAEFAADGAAWRDRVDRDLAAMTQALKQVDARLADGPWLGGARPSLADIGWISTVHRLAHLGWPLPPAVAAWYARWQARPSFAAGIAQAEPPGMAAGQANYAARRRIEGTGISERLHVAA